MDLAELVTVAGTIPIARAPYGTGVGSEDVNYAAARAPLQRAGSIRVHGIMGVGTLIAYCNGS
jgi:hypothetical protein